MSRGWHETLAKIGLGLLDLPAFDTFDQMRPQRLGRLCNPQNQPPRMLDHPATDLQHRPHEPSHVPATTNGSFQLAATNRVQIESQQGKQQRRFVFLEPLRGQVNANRFVKFAKPVLERSTLTIVSEQFFGTARLLAPVGHQEKPTRYQIQLTRFGIGLIDHHEDQSLGVLLRIDLVKAKLHERLVAALGWPPRGTSEMTGGQRIEFRSGLQPT